MNPNDIVLLQELRRDEGVRNMPYKDTVGVWTVGVGHNMEAKPLPTLWKFPLSEDQIDRLLAGDLADVFEDLDRNLPWWRKLTYARQRALCNMVFNLGMKGLLGFTNTLKHIQAGNYDQAATNMLASKWARQVHQRANRLAEMMRNG